MKLPKIFKRVVTAVCALALAAGVAGCGGGGEKEQFINIATGGTAGTYYPIGGAIAEVLNKNGMNASAQSTGASVANINMLKDKQVELAIVQNDITYYAVNGEEMFKEGGKVENLNGIASLYPETCQFVVREDSGIKDITGLKGKRVAVGAAGSGAEANARQILEAYGLTYDDVDEQFLSFAEGSYALKDGTVDAAFVTAGYPTASVQDIASQNKIRLLPVGDEQIKKLAEKYPFYTKTTVPAGTYQGFDQEIQTVSVMAILVANDKIDAALGEKLTKAIFDNLDKIAAAHSAGKNISKATALEGLDFIKMNEGAVKVLK
ncbi:MAG: TAXI family TRAP transporter solute-binding subunit [Selenomonadaceae bacterium]|nr:TAXI family TRAP transporter solute-binding subunit [Selenomonadaceae bacterium]MBQ3725504.1 TAXI family TRAP transporter solute-binding subunit [Selenomonadaceae bacterium]MBQ9495955.1 TAXI family TRAP transporter solute-binding subunit [Selenomonadaceae bacterium]